MDMLEISNLVSELGLRERVIVYSSHSGVRVALHRTDKHARGDFAVELVYPGGEVLRPTHVRLLLDLYIKKVGNRDGLETKLLPAIEKVFAGSGPEAYVGDLGAYPMQIDGPDTQLYYVQLMMAEHDFKFGPTGYREGKIMPPREYLMRFVRWAASGTEIDRVITSAFRNYPPPIQFATRNKGGEK